MKEQTGPYMVDCYKETPIAHKKYFRLRGPGMLAEFALGSDCILTQFADARNHAYAQGAAAKEAELASWVAQGVKLLEDTEKYAEFYARHQDVKILEKELAEEGVNVKTTIERCKALLEKYRKPLSAPSSEGTK